MSQSSQQLAPHEVPEGWQHASLPIEGPLVKRPRLERKPDVVKWFELPHSTEVIPFVFNGSTKVIHCGRDKMKCKKAPDGRTVVQCISGCNTGDRQCMEECQCTCHILADFYKPSD